MKTSSQVKHRPSVSKTNMLLTELIVLFIKIYKIFMFLKNTIVVVLRILLGHQKSHCQWMLALKIDYPLEGLEVL